jgi:hypothetical protein
MAGIEPASEGFCPWKSTGLVDAVFVAARPLVDRGLVWPATRARRPVLGAARGGCIAPWPLVVRSRNRSREVRADGFPYGIRATSGGGVRPPTGAQRSSCDWHLWLRGFSELGASRPAFQNDPPPSKPVIPSTYSTKHYTYHMRIATTCCRIPSSLILNDPRGYAHPVTKGQRVRYPFQTRARCACTSSFL